MTSLVLVLASVSLPAWGAPMTVCGGGSCDFDNLPAAIANASADPIQLHDATHLVSAGLVIDRPVTIEARTGQPIIRCQPGSSAESCIVVNTNVTFRNVDFEHANVGPSPRFIEVGGASPVLVLDHVNMAASPAPVVGSVGRANRGGHVYGQGSTIVVHDGSYVGGTAAAQGGSFFLSDSRLIVDQYASWDNNVAVDMGGAIHLERPRIGDSSFDGALFEDNQAGRGGAISMHDAIPALAINDAYFLANQALGVASGHGGGAVWTDSNSDLSIRGSYFEEHTSAWNGGALSLNSTTLVMGTTEFTGNRSERFGGAVSMAGGDLTTDGVVVWQANSADQEGGCLVFDGGNLVLAGDEFLAPSGTAPSCSSDNGAGGAIRVEDPLSVRLTDVAIERAHAVGHGGAVDVTGSTTSPPTVTIDNSVFTQCQGHHGGALALYSVDALITGSVLDTNVAFDSGGGAIDGNELPSLLIADTTFSENQAVGRGGGLQLYTSGGGTATLDTVTFDNNTATSEGGGARIEGPTTVIRGATLFQHNTGDQAGGALRHHAGPLTIDPGVRFTNNTGRIGGAISLGQTDLTIEGAVFDLNTAHVSGDDGQGGAIDLYQAGAVEIRDSTFRDNVTQGTWAPGGAISTQEGGPFLFEDNDFERNFAQGPGGAVHMSALDATATLRGNRICDNEAEQYGGGVNVDGALTVLADHNTYLNNRSAAFGAALNVQETNLVTMEHEDVLFNHPLDPSSDGQAINIYESTGTLTNSFFAADGTGTLVDWTTSGTRTLAHLYWWQGHGRAFANPAVPSSGPLDPQLRTPPPPPDITCNAPLWRFPQSPLLTAGRDGASNPSYLGALDGEPADWDVDGDGHWDAALGCDDCDDCDDGDAAVNPDATEIPEDGVDNDCVGGDETIDVIVDADGDGCPAPQEGADCQDCDDSNADVHPGAIEDPYNGVDDDCQDGDLVDVDGDGYPSTAAGGTDCDDSDADIYPGAPDEPYDGVNADCGPAESADGNDDDDDADGDGFASAAAGGEDCNDTDASVHPDAVELDDGGLDLDCDGLFSAVVVGGAGCTCESAGGAGQFTWIAGILGLCLRRRRDDTN